MSKFQNYTFRDDQCDADHHHDDHYDDHHDPDQYDDWGKDGECVSAKWRRDCPSTVSLPARSNTPIMEIMMMIVKRRWRRKDDEVKEVNAFMLLFCTVVIIFGLLALHEH